MADAQETKQDKRNAFWMITVAGILVVLLLLYTVMYTVPEGSSAVVKTFGKITKVVDDPGLNYCWPWPFQSVQIIDHRLRLFDVQPAEVLTKDEFNLLVRLSVGWRVTNPISFMNSLVNEARATETLASRVASARQQALQQTALDDIVSAGDNQAERFAAFERLILDHIQQGLADSNFGVEVTFLKVRSLAFPQAATADVQARMIAERKRVSTKYRTDGENAAKMIRDDAQAEASVALAKAEAEAIRIRGEGDAAVVEIYKVFEENPDLMRILVKMEAFRAVVKPNTTMALPADYEPFKGVLQPPATPSAQ